jgi:hypothetical protein
MVQKHLYINLLLTVINILEIYASKWKEIIFPISFSRSLAVISEETALTISID